MSSSGSLGGSSLGSSGSHHRGIGVAIGYLRPRVRSITTPPMHSPQMRRHIVFAVEFLVTHGTWVGFSVQVSGHVMSMEIGGVGIGVVTDFTPIGVPFLQAIRPNRNGGIGVAGAGRAGRAGRIAGIRADWAFCGAAKKGVVRLELEGG